MGMFDFVKDIGGKLFGDDEEKKAAEAAAAKKAADEAAAQKMNEEQQYALAMKYRNDAFAMSLEGVVNNLELEGIEELDVQFADNIATVSGKVPTNEAREKIILALGNIADVSQVDDKLEVLNPEPPAVFYVVQKGDSLSKIAKEHYGDYKKYPIIFEANRPMLTSPDLIYPGQTLRIPDLA